MSSNPSSVDIDKFIEYLIAEDAADRDITTALVVDKNIECHAVIEAKEKGVLCGIDFAEKVFKSIDSSTLTVSFDKLPLNIYEPT